MVCHPIKDNLETFSMSRLNKTASELALDFGVRGATDITGFSFLGHAWEMASACSRSDSERKTFRLDRASPSDSRTVEPGSIRTGKLRSRAMVVTTATCGASLRPK